MTQPTSLARLRLSGRLARGFTLIEMMVAMVLGLIVVAGVLSVFLAGQQSYATNQALAEVDDTARVSFELLVRDVRAAGLTGCNATTRLADVLNDRDQDWFANWSNAVHGFAGGQVDPAVAFGSGVGQRVVGSESVEVIGASPTGLTVAKHNPTAAQFKLNESSADLSSGDLVVVCDPDHSVLVQVTNYNSNNVTLVHNTGTGFPGNCSKGLGYPTACTTNGNSYQFGPNSQLSRLAAHDWYVGHNPVGGTSLYRIDVVNVAGVPTPQPEEMVRNVVAMTLRYHTLASATFLTADQVTAWNVVDAVQVSLTSQSSNARAGTGGVPLKRTWAAVATLRNRVK